MGHQPGTLLVAATTPELCGRPGLVCGVGPVEAASATARALALGPARAVLHVGVAGARGLPLGSVVVGTESRYADLGAGIPVVARLAPAPDLLAAAREALPRAAALPIATSAQVGGGLHDLAVEAMEGFGVLRACALAGVPALELRAVSNELGEHDRQRWDLPGALAALERAVAVLLPALEPLA
jgi:nucleoside phosphorylase